MLTKETVAQIAKDFGRKEGDTGSVEVQVALLTQQINTLTVHMHLKKHDVNRYRELVQKLGLRK